MGVVILFNWRVAVNYFALISLLGICCIGNLQAADLHQNHNRTSSQAWVEANEAVSQAGGWKAYAREKPSPKPVTIPLPVITLDEASALLLKNQINTSNYVAQSEKMDSYYVLTGPQRAALQDRTNAIAELRKVYFLAVSEREKLAYAEKVMEAASASSELMDRMRKVGNANALSQAKQTIFYLKAKLEWEHQKNRYAVAKEKLVQFLNLPQSAAQFEVENRLPSIASNPRALSNDESRAITVSDVNTPASTKARSAARIAYDTYLEKYHAVKVMKEQLLPMRKAISEENLLRYNGMFIGVFELLEDAQAQMETVIQYIDANTALLLQEAALERALLEARLDYSHINKVN